MTLHVMDRLFMRSPRFRDKIMSNFQIFLQLTLGITEKPLVLNDCVSPRLKERALTYINHWNEKFGSDYRPVLLLP